MITEKMVRDTLAMMQRETTEQLRERNDRMRGWLESRLLQEVAGLQLLDSGFYHDFIRVSNLCDDFGVDFWKLVNRIGGMHATRMLIHAVLAVTGRKLVHAGNGSDLVAKCGAMRGISGRDQVVLTYNADQVTCPRCKESA